MILAPTPPLCESVAMPKVTYPLPSDPAQAAKVLKRRKMLVRAQQAWRKRNPQKALQYSRDSMAISYLRRKRRERRAAENRETV